MSSQNLHNSLGSPATPRHHIPSRMGLSNYQRYEGFIKQYMAAYPHPIDLVPEDISVETFAKSFRNAVKSVIKFQWRDADIDVGRLTTIWETTVVCCNPTCVRIGPRDAPRAPEVGAVVSRHAFEVSADDPLAVKAAIVLLSREKFVAPVLLTGDPQVALDYIAKNTYDVELSPCPEAGPESFLMF
jgi:hypothetical protein